MNATVLRVLCELSAHAETRPIKIHICIDVDLTRHGDHRDHGNHGDHPSNARLKERLLDRLGESRVANGTKAIDRWIHQAWEAEFAADFGTPPSAHTIKRWRTIARRAKPGRAS